ncbi:hypothetical protein DL767_007307 [Monosporascus sp. MG133]|nr:hypothetical protein DL767_007307 [Monosporascus sp. MG133]
MDKLSPEILHIIASLLSVDDLLIFRLVSKSFADVGAAYLLPEATFYAHEGEVERLRAISLHPIFSRNVKSLRYAGDTRRFPPPPFRGFVRNHKSTRLINLTLPVWKRFYPGSRAYEWGRPWGRQFEELLLTNASARCNIEHLRAGALTWRFFEKDPAELKRIFSPFSNLRGIELYMSMDTEEDATPSTRSDSRTLHESMTNEDFDDEEYISEDWSDTEGLESVEEEMNSEML